MWETINLLISIFIQILTCNYAISKLTGKKSNYLNTKNIIIIILMEISIFLIMKYQNNVMKPLLLYAIFTIGYKNIYNITYKESIVSNFISIIIHSIAEFMGLVIFVLILKIPEDILYKYFQNMPINSCIIFIIIWLILKYGKNIINKIKTILETERFLYIFYFTGIVGISILFSKNLHNLDNNKDFIANIVTICVFLFIILFLIKEKIDKYTVYKEYDNLFNYLENTESLLEKYQKYNHENKNQLIYIKNLDNKNKELTEFIDSILEEDKQMHQNRWIKELKNIPNGGLKGFLSYKINYMIDKGMKVNISVSPKVKNYKMPTTKKDINKNLCRILGVYIDNAYQASKETRKKEITIEMMIENKELVIVISNTYQGEIDIENIDKPGYTTKGKGHGVGLSLVNEIINSNKFFKQERKVIKNYFFQYLFISGKNS